MATTGFSPSQAMTCGERDRMLLGNADIVVACREALLKLDHARSLRAWRV
jgi:hypothetical protein